jgi:excisionase family DNA binding protein
MNKDSEYLTVEQLASTLQVPKGTIYAWRYKGYGPHGVSIGRFVRYQRSEVERWINEISTENKH